VQGCIPSRCWFLDAFVLIELGVGVVGLAGEYKSPFEQLLIPTGLLSLAKASTVNVVGCNADSD
jgi:hypothetical protein